MVIRNRKLHGAFLQVSVGFATKASVSLTFFIQNYDDWLYQCVFQQPLDDTISIYILTNVKIKVRGKRRHSLRAYKALRAIGCGKAAEGSLNYQSYKIGKKKALAVR